MWEGQRARQPEEERLARLPVGLADGMVPLPCSVEVSLPGET